MNLFRAKRFPVKRVRHRLFAALLAVCAAAAFCSAETGGYFGELAAVSGAVEIMRAGSGAWESAFNGLPFCEGDRLRTAARASCDIELDDGSFIHLAENSDTTAEILELTADRHSSKFSLWFGRVIASINSARPVKMQVRTPTAVAAVRGTEFAVEATEDATGVGVFDGEVEVGADESGESVSVAPGLETTVARGKRPERPVKLREAMARNRDRMAALRVKIKAHREKLQRVPPEKLKAARARSLERLNAAREKRINQKRNIDQRNEELKKPRPKPRLKGRHTK